MDALFAPLVAATGASLDQLKVRDVGCIAVGVLGSEVSDCTAYILLARVIPLG